MDKEELQRLSDDYGIDKKIIKYIYETLSDNEQILKKDLYELLENICFDYMHLDVQSTVDMLSDDEIHELLPDEDFSDLSNEIKDDNLDRINDLSDNIDSIIDGSVSEYIRQ